MLYTLQGALNKNSLGCYYSNCQNRSTGLQQQSLNNNTNNAQRGPYLCASDNYCVCYVVM
jgi:hypothetical protein